MWAYDVSTSAYVKVTSDLLTAEEGLRVAVAHHDGDETEHEERVPEELFDALLHLLLQPPLLLHLLPLLARRLVCNNNQPTSVTSWQLYRMFCTRVVASVHWRKTRHVVFC